MIKWLKRLFGKKPAKKAVYDKVAVSNRFRKKTVRKSKKIK